MNIIELFAGTKSFSNVAEKRGHNTWTTDFNKKFDVDLHIDISDLTLDDIPKEFHKPDILWASPPCQCFSVASFSAGHFKRISIDYEFRYIPLTTQAKKSINNIYDTFRLIDLLEPEYWFIENPRGIMRKLSMMKSINKNSVTYCQYGDERMKPTDIWNNCYQWKSKPMCKNGDNCHISAPRGSRTGTQGRLNATERAKVPNELCLEIIKLLE
jgi:hypothetical protein